MALSLPALAICIRLSSCSFFLKNTKKLFLTCKQTEMAGAEREEFLQFLVEPYLFEPEYTDV